MASYELLGLPDPTECLPRRDRVDAARHDTRSLRSYSEGLPADEVDVVRGYLWQGLGYRLGLEALFLDNPQDGCGLVGRRLSRPQRRPHEAGDRFGVGGLQAVDGRGDLVVGQCWWGVRSHDLRRLTKRRWDLRLQVGLV